MLVNRFDAARSYEAPNHREMRALRLQGLEAGGPEKFWVGLSHFLPGGGAGPDSSPLERVYVVLAGELVIRAGGVEVCLGPMDSCCIAAHEQREVVNEGNAVATMLVVLPRAENGQ